VKPAVAEGAGKERRDPGQFELATSALVASPDLFSYASTPTYRTILEAHGFEEVGERLGNLARAKKWDDMLGLLTDEMLDAFTRSKPPPTGWETP